jgi:hypothetical protein
VDYLGAGPVFGTATKADAGDAITAEGLWRLRVGMSHDLPIIGIGGITAGNAADCVKAGADGVAVVCQGRRRRRRGGLRHRRGGGSGQGGAGHPRRARGGAPGAQIGRGLIGRHAAG